MEFEQAAEQTEWVCWAAYHDSWLSILLTCWTGHSDGQESREAFEGYEIGKMHTFYN